MSQNSEPNGFGIIGLSCIPMRKEDSDTSEMVNNALFGELIKIEEVKNNWTKIKLNHDGYIGWIDTKQYIPINKNNFIQLESSKIFPAQKLITNYCQKLIGFGSLFYSGEPIGELIVFFKSVTNKSKLNLGKETTQSRINLLQQNAHLFLQTPYLWGGRSPFGIDCSGFVQLIFRSIGIDLPRDAYQQGEIGILCANIESAKAGSLAFFANKNNKITHVGLILPDHKIIHAHGEVRIDNISEEGITNISSGKLSHKLHSIRTLL